jgi:dephospho-CoA kinase
MKVIGLCGGSGSGKGLVCKILSEYSVPNIDTDGLYREMTSGDSPCLRALRNEFGESIIGADGSLDHSVLRNIVFSSADSRERRARLNEIAHGYIRDEARNIISQYRERGAEAIVVDAPLLYESGFDA